MAGIIPKIARELQLEPEAAGALIANGMAAGEIGHKVEASDSWIVAPRAAELARLGGFSYETMLNWRTGCLSRPGDAPQPVLVFWPDIERAAQSTASTMTIEHEPTPLLAAPGRGRPPAKREAVLASIREAIKLNVITMDQLGPGGMKRTSLAEMFQTTRPTLDAAIQKLQESPAT